MYVSDQQLTSYIKDQALVAIRRESIDTRLIQGIILQFSNDLLLLQYVHDFHLDGRLVVRREDITEIRCRSTDIFQRQLLIDSRMFDQIDFQVSLDLTSFTSLLNHQAGTPIVIIEREQPDNASFWIGQHLGSTSHNIRLREFTGSGRWFEDPTDVPANEVTCCQLNTNYIQFYADYFRRHPPGDSGN
ncbi:MAG: hypothetical protein NXI04_15105 [Planctomycetaceae bacterium]|nr:hypothetical protein [Planctomycetaceae bacterium]